MKKYLLITGMLIIPMLCIAQIDSTFINLGQSFGINGNMLTIFAGVLTFAIGHFIIPNKWASISLWIEKILYGLYLLFHKINEKTNKN
jgi:uncharacterized membrane protein HdeD (DUF308 family)